MPANLTIGSGPDAVVLEISQDAFQGDAQYAVGIDGVQVGGTLTAEALHASGASDTVRVLGNFAPGQHRVEVSFLNDASGGTPGADRNLYVDSVSFEGRLLTEDTVALFANGTQGVGTFTEALPTGLGFGSGRDTLELWISQDDWLGDAEYRISVDGEQVAPVLTASAERQFGSHDTVWISRDFGPGEHVVTVEFLNDAWGGTAETDRNLYVERVSFNGQVLPEGGGALLSGGPQAVATFTGPPSPEPELLSGTDGPDRLQESLGRGDLFLGGAGADSFAFGIGVTLAPFSPGAFGTTVLGTGVGPGERDAILDFRQGEDLIDLSAALRFARRALTVDQAFDFIDTDEFGGTPDLTGPPELRYLVQDGFTILQMDASGVSRFAGDGTVDAEIVLAGAFTLEAGDFLL